MFCLLLPALPLLDHAEVSVRGTPGCGCGFAVRHRRCGRCAAAGLAARQRYVARRGSTACATFCNAAQHAAAGGSRTLTITHFWCRLRRCVGRNSSDGEAWAAWWTGRVTARCFRVTGDEFDFLLSATPFPLPLSAALQQRYLPLAVRQRSTRLRNVPLPRVRHRTTRMVLLRMARFVLPRN
jgi:hypothetical protein